ncbi:MAG: SDR family oxidoreductase [bacterium]|nr:SDR family oxidoreductase [bacterium]
MTGAARRIGAAIALAFAREGADLILHYHQSQKDLQKLITSLQPFSVQIKTVRADLGKQSDVQRLIHFLEKEKIDILVNNVSVYEAIPFEKICVEQWDRILTINLKTPFFLAQAVGRRMKKRGGQIINIVDAAIESPPVGYLPYSVSKGGLLTLTKALAVELAPQVRVNAVSPGPIEPAAGRSKAFIQKVKNRVPLKRWGGAEEVARAVLFLAKSPFVTGENIVVDGGFRLRG